MEPKILRPTPVDVEYLDRELKKLFRSSPKVTGDPLFIKYKSRFIKSQYERNNDYFFPTKNNLLSTAKKLEILCTYGGYQLVKADKTDANRHNDMKKSNNKATKFNLQGI